MRDVCGGKGTALAGKRRRFAAPASHFVQIETQPGFITTSGPSAGVAGGSMTKAETPSYKLIEQQRGSAAEERGPSEDHHHQSLKCNEENSCMEMNGPTPLMAAGKPGPSEVGRADG